MEIKEKTKRKVSLDWWATICAFAITALVLLGIIPGLPW